ncbi:hypothetical protein GB931_14130 [Modestobacter sp. I12A-02628]|uniref:DoxX family protein n=1 Tax=Goekera deserti TaxID=2497753 RepID=A0A7K3WK41_9ACTN|nr:hypothetical protein [Goekera deserti]MPQ99039.1 hypothetical protein [Goekera deserti]NDI47373.1 hypothetical protein [Goekera deserti]NEL55903.1 hypothetical protein [Goekera deserti]
MSVLAMLLGALMIVSGVTHLTVPDHYARLVPGWVPCPRVVVPLTGLLDVAAGVLLIVPSARGTGGWVTAALITAYLPVHFEPIRHTGTATRPMDRPAGIAARVLVNLGYIGAAVVVAVRT